jgi:hypothetical protein
MVKPMKAPLGGNLLLMVWYRDSISDKKGITPPFNDHFCSQTQTETSGFLHTASLLNSFYFVACI